MRSLAAHRRLLIIALVPSDDSAGVAEYLKVERVPIGVVTFVPSSAVRKRLEESYMIAAVGPTKRVAIGPGLNALADTLDGWIR
jgi:hypothetical protein